MQRNYSNLLAAVTAVCLLAGHNVQGQNKNDIHQKGRENFEVSPDPVYTGRLPYFRSGGKPAAEPAKPAPALKPCSEIRTGLIYMAKRMPAEASLGQEFMYELNPTAIDCAGNVTVTDLVPEGTTYVRSEPAADVSSNKLTWKLGNMDQGQTKLIKVWLRPDKEGSLGSCATVSADPRACASTFVGKPALAITKTGPETAQLGQDVTYNITVSNRGSSPAKNVVVTDTIPNGLTHSTGQKTLTFNVGDLAPGQSRSIPVTVKANERGKFCNKAEAASSNAGKVNAEACTTVLKPGLKIVKVGDKEQIINRNAKYKVTISNTGDTALTGVVVTDTAPSPTSIVSADGATVRGNTATWNVGTLRAGEEKSFNVVLTSKVGGNYCNGATVTTAEKLSDSAQACTVWRGISALLLEKGDNPDPIQVGESTTYYVRVTNQGTADDTNVKVVVEFPKELTPTNADGGGKINGQTVTFPAYPRLAPKQAFEYHITAKGTATGDLRVKFIRTSDDIPASTSAEESTRVY